MILIFGGAYQGMLDYALERFNLKDEDVYRCGESDGPPQNKKIIYELDRWILDLVTADIDIEKAARQFMEINPGAIVICNDISCGVVPVDPIMRKWREAVGRALAMLSQKSDEVVRLFCGIPTRLK